MSSEPIRPSLSRTDFLQFLNQVSPDYLESLREQYRENPSSVSPDWAFFFEVLELGEGQSTNRVTSDSESDVVLELQVLNLINAYRMRGHFVADIDPLGLRPPPVEPHLDLKYFRLENIPENQKFKAATDIGLPPSTVPEIVRHLKNTYTRSVGVEFHYIREEKIFQWLKNHIDQNQNRTEFSAEERVRILQDLYKSVIFENFLQNNYTGQKRFSLEGAESLIPALHQIIDIVADHGAKEVVFGMAHRGRLNVLANIMNKPFQEIFKEFEGADLPELEDASGDVKYHNGFSTDIETSQGKKVHLSLAANPSHLEFVNPVVEGAVRAKQEMRYGSDMQKAVPVLIHGDSAVIGQGVVAETLNLSQLEGYKTGGTIHIVLNNQIGFTTLPEDARSSVYCTDFAKAFQCPIFHVNGDDVEAVAHVARVAAEFRMTFNRDVFIDLVCYRKYGHNEGDEPRFTQPLMYRKIGSHKNPLDIYLEKLRGMQKFDETLATQFSEGFGKELAAKRSEILNQPRVLSVDSLKGVWSNFVKANEPKLFEPVKTSMSEEHFQLVVEKIHTIPENLKPLPKFIKMIETRYEKILKEDAIDWNTAEALAFGSLLLEGYNIRLSGQDSVRGTFSQRHAAMIDNETAKRYFPLKNLHSKQGRFYVYDSPLSEAGVMGFDYGYSTADPMTLVLWEGQFGDFANGAQVIIDQFISSAEAKWYRMSGLTLLLPHGYEGQGPEHSSARLERFLQLCAQNNMNVAYPSTPAQYAHLLRRQMLRNFRKPLIVMTPKSLLRLPECVSTKADLTQKEFHTIIVDECPRPERVVMCAGKIYYDLRKAALQAEVLDKILLVRVEHLYPLDKEKLRHLAEQYGKTTRFVWAQEEPKNMGAWNFIRMAALDLQLDLEYAGRPPAASPATGSHHRHIKEQETLLKQALGL